MTPLAIIPVRIGSKSIPWKNVKPFAGRPMYQRAIEVAYKAGIERVCVTTDDPLVFEEANIYSAVPLMRPPALAADDTPMFDVVKHAALSWNHAAWSRQWDSVVLLQPTSPLRRPEHIRAALKLLEISGADSVVSVVEIPAHYSPDYACEMAGPTAALDIHPPMPQHMTIRGWGGKGLGASVRRQDARKAYSRDGTVYVTRRSIIEAGSLYGDKCVPLIIPPHESANIDTEEDWQRAEEIMRKRLAG